MPKHPHFFPKVHDDRTVLKQSTLNAVSQQVPLIAFLGGRLINPVAPKISGTHSKNTSERTSHNSSQASRSHSDNGSKLNRKNLKKVPANRDENVHRFQAY